MLSEWFYLIVFLCGDLLKRKKKLTFKEKYLFLQIILALSRHLLQHYESEKKRQIEIEETTAQVMLLVEACREFNKVEESSVVNLKTPEVISP